jgi:hypothetical protein
MRVILLAVSLPLAFAIAWGLGLRLIHRRSAKSKAEYPAPVRQVPQAATNAPTAGS